MSRLGHYGGFGNQVFQYAFLRLYAARHGLRYQVPQWAGTELFGHDDPPITDVGLQTLFEPENDSILPHLPQPVVNVDLLGYFQYHTSYYAPQKAAFCELFRPLPRWRAPLDEAIARVRSRNETLVAIHLRRGDYGQGKFFIAPTDWYRQWLAEHWPLWNRPVLYIASDEPDKVVCDFAEYHPLTIEDLAVDRSSYPDYPDYYVLTQADAVATSNSSYSVSASMLNDRARTFVRPVYSQRQLVPYDPWNSPVLLSEGDGYHEALCQSLVGALERQDVADLNQVRRALADQWLTTPDDGLPVVFHAPLGRAQEIAIEEKIFRTEPEERDQDYILPALTSLQNGLGSVWAIQYLLSAMLFCDARQLPMPHDLRLVPSWMLPLYIKYLRAS